MFQNLKMTIPALVKVAGLVFTLGTGHVHAQTLTGRVTHDLTNATAIYDFQFNGPSGGKVALFASVGLPPRPLLLPGIGLLHLDPNTLVQLTPLLPIGSNGRTSWRTKLPITLTNGMTPCFQALFVTRLGTPRVSRNWISLIQGRGSTESADAALPRLMAGIKQ